MARFSPHLKSLHNALDAKSAEEAANGLVQSGRMTAFSLQALCRLYSDADPKFGEMRSDFKGLEDGIGAYDKWKTIYEAALDEKSDEETLARLKKDRDEALATFTKQLVDKGWIKTGDAPSRLDTIDAFLKGYKWLTRDGDRNQVLESISDELKGIKKTTYDMTILEEGDGLHQLRRDIRWVLMESMVVNGLVVYKDDSVKCPLPAYEKLLSAPIATSKYTAFKGSSVEPNPCQLDKCVVLAAAQAVEDLGQLKDQAEREVNIKNGADIVPADLQPRAKAIYDDLVKNNVAGVLKDEVDACQATLKP